MISEHDQILKTINVMNALCPDIEWKPVLDLDKNWMKKYNDVIKFIKNEGRFPRIKSSNKIEKELMAWCKNQLRLKRLNKLPVKKIVLLEKIDNWSWSRGFWRIWTENYDKVIEFKKEKGRFPNTSHPNETERFLGAWCNTQRVNNKNNILIPKRIILLEKIDGWHWGHEHIWIELYNKLLNFLKDNKRLPAAASINEIERKLSYWASKQRINKKNNNLPLEKINLLEKIDGWHWEKDHNSIWNEKCDKVMEFKKEKGRLPNASHSSNVEAILGSWCNTQRINKRNNELPIDQINLLEKINGWHWEKVVNKKWNEKCDKIAKFVECNKRLPAAASINEIERNLGIWIQTQRKSKLKNKISSDRIKSVEEIPGWFWGKKMSSNETWIETCNNVIDFVKHNNHFPRVRSSNKTEKKLGCWCRYQRSIKKNKSKGIITTEKIKLLESIPGWFWESGVPITS